MMKFKRCSCVVVASIFALWPVGFSASYRGDDTGIGSHMANRQTRSRSMMPGGSVRNVDHPLSRKDRQTRATVAQEVEVEETRESDSSQIIYSQLQQALQEKERDKIYYSDMLQQKEREIYRLTGGLKTKHQEADELRRQLCEEGKWEGSLTSQNEKIGDVNIIFVNFRRVTKAGLLGYVGAKDKVHDLMDLPLVLDTQYGRGTCTISHIMQSNKSYYKIIKCLVEKETHMSREHSERVSQCKRPVNPI